MSIKLTHINLNQIAYNKIKSMIMRGDLKGGQKILQDKMAEKLGISKIPLIQALSVLQKERLLDYTPRKGYKVRNITMEEYCDLIDLRGAFESLAVKNITLNLSDPIKKRIQLFINRFEDCYKKDNSKEYLTTDIEFHDFLIKNSGNSYVNAINDSFNILLLIWTKGWKRDMFSSLKEHKEIVSLIFNGKGKEAGEIIVKHIEKAKLTLK
jgi:DNA-binding GntR family transcriptional regulator